MNLSFIIVLLCLSGAFGDSLVDQFRTQCKSGKDVVACVKYRALETLDKASNEDNFQVTDSLYLVRNTKPNQSMKFEPRGLMDAFESLADSHDLKLNLPQFLGGGAITVSPKELDNDSLTINLTAREAKNMVEPKSRRKSKLRKILVPLLVFVLIKAMTLIPLALGVLGLKAWNALQLSFFSFVTSLALAIFQLCKKVATDTAVPAAVHTAWDPYHYSARNFLTLPQEEDGQNLAYSGFTQ